MAYLWTTRDLGLTYDKSYNHPLTGYSDADFAACTDTRRSHSGRVFMSHGGPIMWASKRQSAVTLSSSEAEYVALSQAGRDALWLRRLHHSIGIDTSDSTPLLEDNKCAIKWLDGSSWAKSKHIDIKWHWIREAVQSKALKVSYCNTKAMLADLMTKPLPQHAHTTLTRLVLGGDIETKPYKFKKVSPKLAPTNPAETSLRFGSAAA